MNNPYKEYLDEFFSTLLEYRHATNRLNKVLMKDVEVYTKEDAQLHVGSALVISDWSSANDKGWEVNFHTGTFKETLKKTYDIEAKKMISRECCLMFAQSFEALERYLKDCLFNKASREKELENYVISLQSKPNFKLQRETIPGGDKLFKILKRASGKTFTQFSRGKTLDFKFSELWTVLLETRHSITHSRSVMQLSKVNRSPYHLEIFESLFNSSKIDDDLILILLDYHKFDRLVKKLSEYAFQILKILSIEERVAWEVYK